MRSILLSFCLVFGLNIWAQKTTEENIVDNTIKTIIIEDDSIFKLTTKTNSNQSINIKSKIDGEYAQNTFISTMTKNDTLFIKSAYRAITKQANDKLSAHKIISIELSLEHPENLSLYFNSAIGSAKINGSYKQLFLELNQGNASLHNFYGNATVNTLHGNINLETNYAVIKAKTKSGKINIEKIQKAKNHINLNSISGNINIIKTKK